MTLTAFSVMPTIACVPSLRRISLAVSALAISICGRPAFAGDTWLTGGTPTAHETSGQSDFMTLFTPDAPWQTAAASVRVLKVTAGTVLNASDNELHQMISDLSRRGIGLAMEALMIPKRGPCGGGVEGYSSPDQVTAAALRIKQFAGVLSYVAMDEPLWFGHRFEGANACRSGIDEVAHQVAENVRNLRNVFPDVKIGDIEPIAATHAPPNWTDEILSFARAYEAATGFPLSFFHADLDWHRNWQPVLSDLALKLREERIRFGVIYDGDPEDATDIAWTQHAEERFEAVEGVTNLRPEDAILQTWMRHPTHMLPETQSGTMTSLVLSYVRRITHLTLQRKGDRLAGRLTDEAGTPIADAPITLSVMELATATHPTMRSISGSVPKNAFAAAVALRINTECDCSGSGYFSVGATHYRDSSGTREMDALNSATGGKPLRVVADQTISMNGRPFPVVPGSDFDFNVSIAASSGMTEGGYLAIVFLDDKLKEVQRFKNALTPSEMPMMKTRTNAIGQFEAQLDSSLVGSTAFTAAFAGDNRIRATVATAH
jgi:hypothetical protein